MESKAAEILNEYQENIESMDEVVDTMDDIINEILDKHGEDEACLAIICASLKSVR